jgi:hypothetical protein
MINENFVILGVLISLSGSISYLIDTLRGIAKPNRVSFFFWGLAPLIAFFAEIQQGVGLASLMTFAVGFSPLLILSASFFNKNSYWKITRLDLICGTLSLLGLLLWQIIKVGNVAIFFSIMSDGLASVPTIIKSYRAPETENWKVYFGSAISAAITLMTIKVWNFQNYAFPAYIFIVCLFLFILIKFRIGKKIPVKSL